MSKKNLYQTYDKIADTTVGPIIAEYRDEAAIRLFSDAVQDPESFIGKHPNDYEIRRIGIQDTTNGQITDTTIEPIVSGSQILARLAEAKAEADRIRNRQTELNLTN